MKRIIVLLGVIIGVAAIVFYMKPSEGTARSMASKAKSNSEESSTVVPRQISAQAESSSSQAAASADASQPNTPLYDTKSDLSIQPIDPEKDPANAIESK